MQRVSTYSYYRAGELSLMQRQRDMLTTQAQVASGKRINSPSDDPIGAAVASSTRTALSQFDNYKSNQQRASYLLNLGESTLGQMVDAAQQIKEKLIAAGNGSYSNSERAAIGNDLQGMLAQLVGLANTSDGSVHRNGVMRLATARRGYRVGRATRRGAPEAGPGVAPGYVVMPPN